MSEVRQRKQVQNESSEVYTEKYMDSIAEKAPENVKGYIKYAKPLVTKSIVLFEKTLPYFVTAYHKADEIRIKLEPYKLDLLFPSMAGLTMCFFGGSFLTLIAAAEAYIMCGYESTLQGIKDIQEDFIKLLKENKEDDEKDDNKDGVKDVLQISSSELATRKALLFLRSVDPRRVTSALGAINAGFLAVIATLKLQFAKAITLGNAIAAVLDKPAKRFAIPFMESLLPPEYRKWSQPVIEYTIKSIAISVAWSLQRVISAYHSAIRGGLMCSRNIMQYLSQMKYIQIDMESTYLDEIAGFGLAAAGLWFQLNSGFTLSFPLNLVLMPFSMMEYTLMWIVNSK